MPRASSLSSFSRCLPVLAGLSLTPWAVPAWAQDTALEQPLAEPSAAPSDDRARWGLGIAAGVRQQPYTDAGNKSQGLPLVYFENRHVRVFGTGAELKLPALELGGRSSLSFGLRARYGLGGYKPDDAPVLSGMEERKGSIWLGAGLVWRNELADVSLEWLGDASGKSKGQHLRLGVQRDFRAGRFTFTPRLEAVWVDDKYVDYYYGVRAQEVRIGRPLYLGRSSVNTEIGLRVGYAIDRHQSVFLDVGSTQLGKQIKNSPLVNRSSLGSASVGYLYRF